MYTKVIVCVSDFRSQINFEYFDLVGGQEAFQTECLASAAAAQADKVCSVLRHLCRYCSVYV